MEYFLFGLQNSGTRWCEFLLKNSGYNVYNAVRGYEYYWKHGFGYKTPPPKDRTIVVYRNPQDWYNRAITGKGVPDGHMFDYDYDKLWYVFHDYWKDKAAYTIRYEDLIREVTKYFPEMNVGADQTWYKSQKSPYESPPCPVYDSIKTSIFYKAGEEDKLEKPRDITCQECGVIEERHHYDDNLCWRHAKQKLRRELIKWREEHGASIKSYIKTRPQK